MSMDAPVTTWQVGLLQTFRLERGGEVVARLGRSKEELLLAYLALAPQGSHLRTTISGALWPDLPPEESLRRLSFSLWALRRRFRELGLLDPVFIGARTLQLNAAVATDVQRFSRALVDAMHVEEPAQKALLLQEAVTLYGDGLLPTMPDPWIEPERTRLAQACEDARLQLAELLQVSDATVALLRHLPAPAEPTPVRPGAPMPSATPSFSPAGPTSYEELLALVTQAEPHLNRADRDEWLALLDRHYEILETTLDKTIQHHERTAGLSLAAPLWRYWYARRRIDEGRRYLDELLALPASRRFDRVEAAALHAAGTLAFYGGDTATARSLLTEALAVWRRLDDDRGLEASLANLGSTYTRVGDDESAREIFTQALAIARRLEDEGALSPVLLNLALLYFRQEDLDSGHELLTERLAIAERTKDPHLRASTLAHLAMEALYRDDFTVARSYAQETLDTLATMDRPDARLEALAYQQLGRVAHDEGDFTQATHYYARSLRSAQASGQFRELGHSQYYLGRTYQAAGHPRKAAAAFRQAVDLLHAAGDTVTEAKARAAYEESKGRTRRSSPA